VRYRWILGLTLASLGMWMANQTPLQVLLALQLQDITPRHKIVALGVVTRGRGHRVGPSHSGGRRAVRPDRARRAAGAVQRPAAPMDAGHGGAGLLEREDYGEA
jgi:hypothetical protein